MNILYISISFCKRLRKCGTGLAVMSKFKLDLNRIYYTKRHVHDVDME